MGTKIVMTTKKPKKKLSPRSSIQKGNSGASVGFCTIIPYSVVCQLGPVRAFICGATVGVSGPRSFSFHVKPEHAFHALESVHGGAVEEGNVGGGTGMVCNEFQ